MTTVSLFTQRVKRFLSATVAASLALTSTLPGLAAAQSCDAYAAKEGRSAHCAARDIGGVPIAYPKFVWDELSEMASLAPAGGATSGARGGPQAMALANRTALALGLDSDTIAQITTIFPSNVPYVLGRYNPTEGKLRIDVFKLEKTTGGGAPTVRMLQSQFTPAHGHAWRASRSYISPNDFVSGNVPGVNPFHAFEGNRDGQFHDISVNGAQVAIGHAMRAFGAGIGALAITDTRVSSVTKKSGGFFKKTVRTWVYGHAKPKWMLALPKDVLRQSTTAHEAAYCTSDPTTTNCPLYATATSGVSFEEFSGGTLNAAENTWEIDFKKSSGLTFIGALFLGVLGSFALAGLMSAAGIGAAAGGIGAAGGAASGTAGTALGGWGTLMSGTPVMSAGISQLGAIAFEVAVTAGSMALIGGANLSSIIKIDPGVFTGSVNVSKGLYDPPRLSDYDGRINAHVRGLIAGEPGSTTSMLDGVVTTILGEGCAAGSTAAECRAKGIVPRTDTFVESNQVEFVKDGLGKVLRASNPF
jgi:hypothetical protein